MFFFLQLSLTLVGLKNTAGLETWPRNLIPW